MPPMGLRAAASHGAGSREAGEQGKGTYPLCLDDSAGGPCWRHSKGIRRRGQETWQGTVLGGEKSATPSLSMQLLHQGAGQLSAPNLYQPSKNSIVLTLAAELHRERIQCLIDGSWSST